MVRQGQAYWKTNPTFKKLCTTDSNLTLKKWTPKLKGWIGFDTSTTLNHGDTCSTTFNQGILLALRHETRSLSWAYKFPLLCLPILVITVGNVRLCNTFNLIKKKMSSESSESWSKQINKILLASTTAWKKVEQVRKITISVV